ncbi:MAG: hypothetical protein WC673_01810 [Candidatus Paceibacterota bacterium]|jgi:hypothetical protein
MKRLVFFAFILVAGALFASAAIYPNRVNWLPTTEVDIVSYKRAEINKIRINLYVLNVNGNYNPVDVSANTGLYRWKVASWDLEGVTSNKISSYLNSFLAGDDPGTNSYYVMITWEAWYDSDGISCTFAPNGFWGINQVLGTQVIAKSPMFYFPRLNGKPVIPAEAFNLSANWTSGYAGIPAIGKGIKWVDYLGPVCGYIPTKNGGNPTGFPGNQNNGFIYVSTQTILDAAKVAKETGEKATFTVWYDESRTDGTEWNLANSVKREIIPPQLSISGPENGLLKIAFSGILSGSAYTLERSPMPSFPTTNIVGTVISDTNGIAVWYYNLVLAPRMFFRARPATSGETAR